MAGKIHLDGNQPPRGSFGRREPPHSVKTVETYKLNYGLHLKDDPITSLMMSEVEEEDVLEFTSRMAARKIGRAGERRAMVGQQDV